MSRIPARVTRYAVGLSILALAALPAAAVEPVWMSFFDTGGYDDYKDMAVDASGNIYLTGTIGSHPETSIGTVKFAADGSQLWSAIYDGPGEELDISTGIAVDGIGGIYVVGRSPNPVTSSDYIIIRYDAQDGTELWVRLYDGPEGSVDQANAVVADASGAYVTGVVQGDGQDFGTVRYDTAGTLVWQSIYEGPGSQPFANDQAVAIAFDPAGDVVVTGGSAAFNGIDDFATVKYSAADGAQLWAARYDGVGLTDISHDLTIDGSGDVYVTGTTYQSGEKMATVRYDGATGAQVWAEVDDPGIHDHVYSIVVGDGNVCITGVSDPDGDESNGNDNVYTNCRSASDGTVIWEAYHGTNGFGEWDGGIGMILDGMENLFVTGRTNSFGAADDILLLHYDATAGTEVERTVIAPGSFDTGWDMALHPDGGIIVAGIASRVTKDLFAMRFPSQSSASAGEEGPAASAALLRVAPNPFGSRTTLSFDLPKPGRIVLSVLDVRGREIGVLARGAYGAGWHSIDFDVTGLASGTYFYRLRGNDFRETGKMLVVGGLK